MTRIPADFPLPQDAFERQRALLVAHIGAARGSSPLTRRRAVAVASLILVGAVLVAPAVGIGGRLFDLIRSSAGAPPPAVHVLAWSPDGRTIAFVNWRDGNEEIYAINADGSGKRNLTRSPAADLAPIWSPNGL